VNQGPLLILIAGDLDDGNTLDLCSFTIRKLDGHATEVTVYNVSDTFDHNHDQC
jgi:hypothetical protein